VVKRLTAIADRYREALGDSLTGTSGTENRPVGRNDAE
jgi:hypothetical protein